MYRLFEITEAGGSTYQIKVTEDGQLIVEEPLPAMINVNTLKQFTYMVSSVATFMDQNTITKLEITEMSE